MLKRFLEEFSNSPKWRWKALRGISLFALVTLVAMFLLVIAYLSGAFQNQEALVQAGPIPAAGVICIMLVLAPWSLAATFGVEVLHNLLNLKKKSK